MGVGRDRREQRLEHPLKRFAYRLLRVDLRPERPPLAQKRRGDGRELGYLSSFVFVGSAEAHPDEDRTRRVRATRSRKPPVLSARSGPRSEDMRRGAAFPSDVSASSDARRSSAGGPRRPYSRKVAVWSEASPNVTAAGSRCRAVRRWLEVRIRFRGLPRAAVDRSPRRERSPGPSARTPRSWFLATLASSRDTIRTVEDAIDIADSDWPHIGRLRPRPRPLKSTASGPPADDRAHQTTPGDALREADTSAHVLASRSRPSRITRAASWIASARTRPSFGSSSG